MFGYVRPSLAKLSEEGKARFGAAYCGLCHTLGERYGQAVISFKNTSKYELDISPDELTERFVRGDSSRSTEGSGLGLSIARSLTEL